ncbi:UbiD family decarboxylase [Fictibacillus macauensis ZFHKF-1]|uniref:UbiD family decarboxylase n=1 Tax=Fictibacillus macauensis ZFHKF-1 TaxID=1196324 RepID=I8UCF2_9BACL|nr:UbiD family decarboxylase [Fictibacillus macauensis]EIT84595.1 UbiD family decarboxylase [Fictibacillus macauensis ZFHKF-1]
MHTNLRSFMKQLQAEKEIIEISAETDPYLEIPEIHRRIIDEEGPALLFTNVKGSDTPVVTNLFGTLRRVELAFGPKPEALVKELVASIDDLLPPSPKKLWDKKGMIKDVLKLGTKTVKPSKAPITEYATSHVNMKQLPALTGWHLDSNPFVTLPLVYTEHPDHNEHNLGMYRIEIKEEQKTGIHWQIHKGGGFHHYAAEQQNKNLPVTLFLGGPPALIISAIAPLPEAVPELMFSSMLMGEKLAVTHQPGHPHPLIAEAEFAFGGYVPPHVREPEGPFGDHYGYYSWAHDFPVFNVNKMWKRNDAIYPATVVGKPKQEDYFIGEYLQRLMSPLFPVVMNGVQKLWTYAETGFHALAGAVVRESYYKEGLAHALRIMGEGQLTLTKFLMVTNKNVELQDFSQLLEAVLERFMPERDLLILNDTSMDTLDYTGRKFNTGSKAIMTGLGEPIRELKRVYDGGTIDGIRQVQAYCGGCLCVSGPSFEEAPDFAMHVVNSAGNQLADWPLVFLVDDASIAATQAQFLWTTFTRFDPAFDLYATSEIVRNKIKYSGPIVIDARMKPFYPETVETREDINTLVSTRWKEYFA